MRTVLQRNDMWSDDVQGYLLGVAEHCNDCVAASLLPPSHKAVLGVLICFYTAIVMAGHFYLERVRILNAMDTLSKFSADYIVPDTTLHSVPDYFESMRAAQFGAPKSVQRDQAFGS